MGGARLERGWGGDGTRSWKTTVAACGLLVLTSIGSATAQDSAGGRRVALVVGNDAYQAQGRLNNGVNDAQARVVCGRGRNPTLRTLTQINLPSLAICGLFGFYAAQRGTGGHDCRQVRGGVAGIG